MEDNLPNYYTMHCDRCGKNYRVRGVKPSLKEFRKWLGRPCDRCGANLFTKADYNMSKIIFAIAWVDRQIAKVLRFFHVTVTRTTVRFQSDGEGHMKVTTVTPTADNDINKKQEGRR